MYKVLGMRSFTVFGERWPFGSAAGKPRSGKGRTLFMVLNRSSLINLYQRIIGCLKKFEKIWGQEAIAS